MIHSGMPDVIFCPGKTTEQIISAFLNIAEKGNNVLATRADEKIFDALIRTGRLPRLKFDKIARTIILEQKTFEHSVSLLPIITGGAADLPVASEARATAEIMGHNAEIISDVGKTGMYKLVTQLKKLREANVIIVVAGMEGSLPSVVAGLVDCPVIAVPTSVGSGASFQGIAPLLTMLNSCSPGVSVVNIDNGYAAAVCAVMINKKLETAKVESVLSSHF
ncbi:MAG TPA: nickel pincer cofactor biosynthesis protein LarB [Phycisphaerales bacterium]|nr:nickel pincer cofactor biosynthesis protein LarB [Phycisphaerales bacterium]